MQKHQCRRELRDDQHDNADVKLANPIKLANLILCLEGSIRDGDKISPECQNEIIEHRKILMTDYQLNPDLVKRCAQEVAEHCGNDIEPNGKTLHCLIRTAKLSRADKSLRFSNECFNQVRM